MNKTFALGLLLSVCSILATAQSKTEDFNIDLPAEKIGASRYSSIRLVDSRYDTSNMGIVQLGAFNRKVRVVPKVHLSQQLQNVLGALNPPGAGSGELLFHLRHFNFAEITGATSERGYCHMKADIYASDQGRYLRVSSIDTVVAVKSLDVTKSLFRNGSKLVNQLLGAAVVTTPTADTSFSFEDIQRMDDLEKLKLPLYTAETFKNGIYNTYESFSKQEPDNKGSVFIKKGKIASISAVDESGKEVKVKSKDIYAVVHDGTAYVATDYGYYPLQKLDNDLVFTGRAKVNANAGDVIAASVFFGIIGGLIASDAAATFEMKLDHSNGGFIRLREVIAAE